MNRYTTLFIVICVALGFALPTLAQEVEQPFSGLTLPIEDHVIYTVAFGDTLNSIGALFDVDVDCLIETNQIINANRIEIGQDLLILTTCSAYDGAMPITFPRLLGAGGAQGDYLIKSGDNLDTIARAYNVSVTALATANNITNYRTLQPGAMLTIPTNAPAYGAIVSTSEQGGGANIPGTPYVMQFGDTLDGIGFANNLDPKCIQTQNNIVDNTAILVGSVVVLPTACGAYPTIEQIQGGTVRIATQAEIDAITQGN
ncbi:MAG: LysM peptidoglycan-binding domain-containing protein [Phototrophicaceae bacterium]